MLNENQQKVVEYNGNKPLLVEAGPGSGKTRVIIERVKFLINELKVNPSSLLVITFTRKAANELKDRLSEDIPKNIINEMQISTIHSFCLDFIKKRGAKKIKMMKKKEMQGVKKFLIFRPMD